MNKLLCTLGQRISLVEMHGATICMVKCKTCSHLEGKDKFLQPKIGNLWKHVGRWKTLVDGNGSKKGDHHMKKDCKHAKNDMLQVCRIGDNVLDQLYYHATLENKRNGFNSPQSCISWLRGSIVKLWGSKEVVWCFKDQKLSQKTLD